MIDVSALKDAASESLVVRIETNLYHVISGCIAVDRIFTSLVEMLQCSVRIASKPVVQSNTLQL